MAMGRATEGDLSSALIADTAGAPAFRVEWPDPVTIAVGPEGGLTEAEVASVDATLSLGSTVLRSETAAIAAAVLALQ